MCELSKHWKQKGGKERETKEARREKQRDLKVGGHCDNKSCQRD